MSSYPVLQTDVYNNPIAWREAVGVFRSRSQWFWRVACAITAFVVLIPVLHGQYYFWRSLNTAIGILLMMNIILFPMFIVRTITMAVDSVARERRGQTWELLLLTGVSTWRVIMGKWLGTLRGLLRDCLWLYGLRLALFAGFIAERSLHPYLRDVHWRDYDTVRDSLTLFNVQMDVGLLLLVAGITAVYLLLELLLSSAMGLAIAFFPWSHKAGAWVAIGLRVGVAVLFFLVFNFINGSIRPYPFNVRYPETMQTFLHSFSGALTENSAMVSASIITAASERTYIVNSLLAGLVLGTLPYLALTLFSLRAAVSVAYRAGVNPAGPETRRGTKTKAKRDHDYDRDHDHDREPHAPAEVPAVPAPSATRPAPGTANVFKLAAPEQYQVELFHYQRSLSRLLLRLHRAGETRYLRFSSVGYVDAPLTWAGANFHTAPDSDYVALAQGLNRRENSFTADGLRLYTVVTPEKTIRILAGAVELLDEPHPAAL
ncbi:MAG: hypothetical protein MUE40_06045 [Anaerolineae bacterium]|nr:hypothetical protein [Anaerolineae bacterium]